MSSDRKNRYTQFDLSRLAGLRPALRGQLTERGNAAVEPSVGKNVRFLDTVDPMSGFRAHEYITRKAESPWGSYERIYELRLGVGVGRVTVAERRSSPF